MNRLRFIMLLPLVTFLLTLYPIRALETSLAPHTFLYRPSSLDDCVKLATKQLARWKQVYGVCIAMFFNQGQGRQPGHELSHHQSDSASAITMTTDAQFQGVTDVSVHYSSSKRSSEVGKSDDSGDFPYHQGDVFAHDSVGKDRVEGVKDDKLRWSRTRQTTNQGQLEGIENDKPLWSQARQTTSQGQLEDIENGKPLWSQARQTASQGQLEGKEKDKRQWLRARQMSNQSHQGTSSVVGRTVFRSRRRHSLSINSALVSLADMLMVKDYDRQRERQRAFRQQLLGLGR